MTVTAIYSGTFDPIHIGHAMVCNYISQYAPVDEVWLMASPLNPLKKDTHPMSDTLRYRMTREVAARCRNVRASDFEMHLPLPSYTYNTLTLLSQRYPDRDFRLVIGSDNWVEFHRWRNPDKILQDFGVIIYPRPGFPIDESRLPANALYLPDAPQIQMSSTFVRQAMEEGRDISFFVPDCVITLLEEFEIYKKEPWSNQN